MASSDLVRTLKKNNFFVPITFGQYKVLNTIFNKEVIDDIDFIDLEYNEEQCTKLIKENIKKMTENDNKTYWYTDFEADTSTEIHKPFLCKLQNRTGRINKTFQGEDCNKQLLDYLPDDAVVYFHNLAYDIRMLASFGLAKSIIKGTKTIKADIKYLNNSFLQIISITLNV